ncbi:MAG: sensor histidine kinase [Firmicutes bacterium]|nr:sensor histidine kinase [Bacillota bacterium]
MFGQKSIVHKYLTAFIFIIVLPIFSINILLNAIYRDIILKNASDRILQALEQIAIGIENEGKRISLSAATVSNDDELLELLTQLNRTQDHSLKLDISKTVNAKLNYLFNHLNTVESVIFFFKDEGFFDYKNAPNITDHKMRKMEWYRKAIRNKGKTNILGSLKSFTYNSQYTYTLSVAISPGISEYRNDVEMIYFAFRTNIFTKLYSGLRLNRIGEIMILDTQGRIMGANNATLLGKSIEEFSYEKKLSQSDYHSFIENIDNHKVFITSYTIPNTGWKLINLIDYTDLTRDAENVMKKAIAFFLLITILFFIFSTVFFKDIILPIKYLINKMKVVEKGNFDTYVEMKSHDEIYELGNSFNNMVRKIKNLIKEKNLKERERSKAEIEALQFQINPHFINNTLNSIRLMAMIAKVDSIKNMTEAFMKLLSDSLSKSNSLTTIEQELDNLKNYIYLMKVRYGDQFDVIFQVKEEIKTLHMLKLILQPLVENAILHGMQEMEEKGIINVKGRLVHDRVVFEITDNGVGMTQEQINRLLSSDDMHEKSFNRIGIKNVDMRIKLNHGQQYGIGIESVRGKFTKVKIVLPIISEEDDENV